MKKDLPLQLDLVKVLCVTQPGHLYALASWLSSMQSVPLHTMGIGDKGMGRGHMWGVDMAGLEKSAQERLGY